MKARTILKKHISAALAMTLAVGTMVISGQVAKGATSNYDYGEAFEKTLMFYEFQKSGKLSGEDRNNWRGDSGLDDGKDVGHDLTGGWYDCGDHVKFNLPMAYTSTMLAWSYLESKDTYKKSGQEKYLLDEVKWANDYFIKCHTAPDEYYYQVGDGGKDHSFWGAAEVLQMERPAYKVDLNNPGSAVCAEGAASLASSYLVFKDKDPAYAAKCLKHAKELYSLAERMKGDSGYAKAANGFYSSSHFYDDLSWAGMWIYLATDDATYLQKAKDYSNYWDREGQTDEIAYGWAHCWDDVHYGAELLIAMNDKSADAARYKKAIENNLDYWTTGINGERVKYTPKGLAWRDQWGSLRYAANQSFLASVYADWKDADPQRAKTYQAFAKSQADYILGSTGHSYIVGVGKNYSKNTHHRTAHGTWLNSNGSPTEARHLLVGAMVGGPDSNDGYKDEIPDYILNEVGCDYNAGAVALMSKMYADYGGTIDPNLNANEEVGEELFMDASINAQDDRNAINFVELKTVIENRTAWPARVTDKLSFRYFVDISDVLAQGYKASDMQVISNYSQHKATVSALKPWDAAKGIYYVEIGLAGAKIYPGGQSEHKCEIQFRIAAPGKWDYKKSPSYQGLEGTSSNNMVRATNMALYDDGKLVFGQEPGASVQVAEPVVSLTSPANGASYNVVTKQNPIKVTASASVKDSSISKVEFYANGTKIGEDTTAPFTADFVPTETATQKGQRKEYTLTAKAYAKNGTSKVSDAVKVTAELPFTEAPVVEKPVVTLTAPKQGDTIDMSQGIKGVELAAQASVKNGNIKKVVFYVNDQQVGEADRAPYKVNFLPAGTASKLGDLASYTVKATAIADNGQQTTTNPVTFKVQLPVAVSGASVAIVSPQDGQRFEQITKAVKVVVNAKAVNDNISRVEFYANGQKFAEATRGQNGNYEAIYNVTGLGEKGKLTPVLFTAKAFTNQGKEAVSKNVTAYIQLEYKEDVPPVGPTSDVKVSVNNTSTTQAVSNTIGNQLRIKVQEGNQIALSKLVIRYYYTADGNQEQKVWCDNAAAQMNKAPWYVSYTGHVEGRVVKMDQPTSTADSYIEMRFNTSDTVDQGAEIMVDTRTSRVDWSNYDQSNDFSYKDSNKIAVFYDGQLIAGVTP